MATKRTVIVEDNPDTPDINEEVVVETIVPDEVATETPVETTEPTVILEDITVPTEPTEADLLFAAAKAENDRLEAMTEEELVLSAQFTLAEATAILEFAVQSSSHINKQKLELLVQEVKKAI